MSLPAPQALAALAGTPTGWGHHTSKTVIYPHTSAQTVRRLAMFPGSWETFSVGWLQKCIFSLSTWLRTIYCLQTIHEPACVILTLFQFLLWSCSRYLVIYICLTSVTRVNSDSNLVVCRLIFRPLPLNFNTHRKLWWWFFHISTVFNTVFNMVFNMPNINIFNTPWNFDVVFNMHYSFQHTLKCSTCCFNIVLNLHYSFQHTLKCSTCCFNIVFNTYYSFQHALKFSRCFFNTPWNIQHSFELALQFLTCTETFNTLFQHALQFSEHNEMFNIVFYSFQNMLKISTCFFTVFRTCWKFQHAFFTVFNTLFQYVFKMCYRFQHTLKFSTHFQTWKCETFRVKL